MYHAFGRLKSTIHTFVIGKADLSKSQLLFILSGFRCSHSCFRKGGTRLRIDLEVLFGKMKVDGKPLSL